MTRRSSSTARRMYERRSPRFDPRATTTVLLNADLVGQLVDVAGAARKIRLQMLAGGGDRLDDPVREFALLETDGQLRGDFTPETGRHLLVHPAVAEDHDLPRFGGDEQKDAVSRIRFRHAEPLEGLLR